MGDFPPSATHLLYRATGHAIGAGGGPCWLCGAPAFQGVPVAAWVKENFTGFDRAFDGADEVCAACLYCADDRHPDLTARLAADKPQRMRNYSHFVAGGVWHPLSKARKAHMRALLLDGPFPEVAAIGESGQKHILFRARPNPPGQTAGWVQFEEQALWVSQSALRLGLEITTALLDLKFSKAEVETGRYRPYRITRAGLPAWRQLEVQARAQRNLALWPLVVFLAQPRLPEGEKDADRETQA